MKLGLVSQLVKHLQLIRFTNIEKGFNPERMEWSVED